MCTTCNCFKHKSNDIYYTAFTVILIKNMINKRNHTMTTVRRVSQCSSLRYSFSFSHKCPGLVGASSWLQSDALCENAHHHADYSSAQWAVTTLVRYATRTVLAESCLSAGHQGKAFDRCKQTYFTTPSAAAGAPGTDAADDALAAVGLNCSSSSELSAPIK